MKNVIFFRNSVFLSIFFTMTALCQTFGEIHQVQIIRITKDKIPISGICTVVKERIVFCKIFKSDTIAKHPQRLIAYYDPYASLTIQADYEWMICSRNFKPVCEADFKTVPDEDEIIFQHPANGKKYRIPGKTAGGPLCLN